jgi:hypothetical protein
MPEKLPRSQLVPATAKKLTALKGGVGVPRMKDQLVTLVETVRLARVFRGSVIASSIMRSDPNKKPRTIAGAFMRATVINSEQAV